MNWNKLGFIILTQYLPRYEIWLNGECTFEEIGSLLRHRKAVWTCKTLQPGSRRGAARHRENRSLWRLQHVGCLQHIAHVEQHAMQEYEQRHQRGSMCCPRVACIHGSG